MALKDKIKTALDETRMLILGTQVLLGFQFRGAFEEGFESLPAHVRFADAAALALMLLTAALLITPSAYHRIAEGGTATGHVHNVITWFAAAALLPFAISLGLDTFIGIERIAGRSAGILAGLGFAALALLGWYGVEAIVSRRVGEMQRRETASQASTVEDTPLHTRIEQMLTESRVILPGVQALFGFQLAIVLTNAFERVPGTSKLVHGLAVGLVVLAMILLMAPAAYHRIVYAGSDAPEFLQVSGWLVAAATLPLAFGLAGDTYVVFAKITESASSGAAAALVALVVLLGLWHVYPLAVRRRRQAEISVQRLAGELFH